MAIGLLTTIVLVILFSSQKSVTPFRDDGVMQYEMLGINSKGLNF